MKSHVLLSFGELYRRNGRPGDGIQIVKEAIELAKRHDERLALASGHVLLGQLNERMDNHEMADKEFRSAIRLLGAAGRTDRLAETHAAYAEILDARGDGRLASRQWKQAAKLALQRRPAACTPRGRLAKRDSRPTSHGAGPAYEWSGLRAQPV